jgi:hypothetical protein
VHLNVPERRDVLQSDKKYTVGWSRLEEWIYMYSRAEICYNCKEDKRVHINLLDSGDVLQSDKEHIMVSHDLHNSWTGQQ